MIELIGHKVHPFDQISMARRYFVVFWCNRAEGKTEIQTLVQSTENDVAEVLAWAKREAASPEIDAESYNVFVVVDQLGDQEPWLLQLSGTPYEEC